MLLKRQRKLGAVGFFDGDVVFNAQRVQRLAAKVFTHHAGTNALARCIHGSRSTRGSAADHQHVECVFGINLFGLSLDAFGVDFCQDFFQAHAALTKFCAIQKHSRHGHDLALFNFVLKRAAFNHGGANAWVLYGHHVQCLHHVGTVVAGQGDVNFKVEVTVQVADLLKDFFFHLGRVAADLQQRQNQ